MAQCPRCKEDMPLLSKICPVCGYVEEGSSENDMSVGDFVKVLEARLNEIKYIPEPSFVKGMGHFTFIIYPILAIAFLFVFLMSNSGLFMIAFLLFLILSVVAWVRKSKGMLGYTPFNTWFKVVKNDFEYHKRVAQHSFGKSSEISRLIDDISQEIRTVEKKRSEALKRNKIVWSVIVVLLLGIAVAGVLTTQSALTEKEAVEQSWSVQFDEYKAGKASNEEQARLNIVNAMLAEDDSADAEYFFINECMGKMQDYDCAAAIVNYYMERADEESAMDFVERCTGMRYASDRNKLIKLIQ